MHKVSNDPPPSIYTYKAVAIEVLVMKWFSSGERGERMKKKPTGHFASKKGKVGCGGGGPGCLWCGQQPSTAPIEPNAGGSQQPKLSRVTTTRFRCSVGPSLRYWANESETMAFPVHHFLSLFPNQKRPAMPPCTLFHLVLSENNAVFLLWRFLLPSCCFSSACLSPILTKKTAENNNPWFFYIISNYITHIYPPLPLPCFSYIFFSQVLYLQKGGSSGTSLRVISDVSPNPWWTGYGL